MLYAESSAVVAWLFGGAMGVAVGDTLRAAPTVITSELTLVECDRALHRVAALGTVAGERVAHARTLLEREGALWGVLPISAGVVARARGRFPDDGLRALDAIHLATVLQAAAAVGDLDVLTVDARVRRNARALGLRVIPD